MKEKIAVYSTYEMVEGFCQNCSKNPNVHVGNYFTHTKALCFRNKQLTFSRRRER